MPAKQSLIKFGFGRRDITPDPSVRLGGYGIEIRPAEIINDRLNVTSIFISKNGKKILLISLDWLGIEEEDVDKIQEKINAKTGISKQNIIISTIHSHTTPNTIGVPGWGNKEKKYIEKVIPAIVASAVEASKKLLPVKIGVGSIYSETGVNRRGINIDGNINFGADPDGSFDPEMTVISFKDENEIVGMIVHYGAHATAFGTDAVVSRDWPGVMVDRIEKQIKAPVMFINGSIGDTGPRTSFLMESGFFSAAGGDGVDTIREVGYRAAADALNAIVKIKNYSDDIILDIITEEVLFPYAPLHGLEKAKCEIIKLEPDKNKYGTPMYMYSYWNSVVKEHEKPEQERAKGKSYLQSILRLGDIVLIPFSGELFSGTALRIRKSSPFQYTLCSSVTNGCIGYIPTREARHRGGYEVWFADHLVYGYGLAENIDDILVEDVLKRLGRLKTLRQPE
ncbi:MAG: neutral/alkaline non-lysosomal ceramidase N-terminal domain-containing protein [Victivallales bacterium]|nr:neutral/alkaline non-lysosomal ceramidase N-terminal domain-containing protein [Victivallales bacterium]